jgi:hypothetical protein
MNSFTKPTFVQQLPQPPIQQMAKMAVSSPTSEMNESSKPIVGKKPVFKNSNSLNAFQESLEQDFSPPRPTKTATFTVNPPIVKPIISPSQSFHDKQESPNESRNSVTRAEPSNAYVPGSFKGMPQQFASSKPQDPPSARNSVGQRETINTFNPTAFKGIPTPSSKPVEPIPVPTGRTSSGSRSVQPVNPNETPAERKEREIRELKARYEQEMAKQRTPSGGPPRPSSGNTEPNRFMKEREEAAAREREYREREAADLYYRQEEEARLKREAEQQKMIQRQQEERQRREQEERKKEQEEKRLFEEQELIRQKEEQAMRRREEELKREQEHYENQQKKVIVRYPYTPEDVNEVELVEGCEITNIIKVDEGWWQGTNHLGQTGLFPSNYVEEVDGTVNQIPIVNHGAKIAVALVRVNH